MSTTQQKVILREGSQLASDIPEGAVADIVETVNQRTGKREFFKAYTSEELTKLMREAPMAVGRDPQMVGVRTGSVEAREMRTAVDNAHRAGGSELRISQETFTKTVSR